MATALSLEGAEKEPRQGLGRGAKFGGRGAVSQQPIGARGGAAVRLVSSETLCLAQCLYSIGYRGKRPSDLFNFSGATEATLFCSVSRRSPDAPTAGFGL